MKRVKGGRRGTRGVGGPKKENTLKYQAFGVEFRSASRMKSCIRKEKNVVIGEKDQSHRREEARAKRAASRSNSVKGGGGRKGESHQKGCKEQVT